MIYSSNTSDFAFTRKITVKSLFNIKGIFAQFGDLHFLSFNAFSNFMLANLYTSHASLSQHIIVDLKTREELGAMLKIVQGTSLTNEVVLTLHFESDLLEAISEMITDQKIELSVKPETIEKANNQEILLPPLVPCWTEYKFDADTYGEQYEKMIKLWLRNPRCCLIDLQFDYASFENKPMSELHRLYFYMNMLHVWLTKGAIGLSTNDPGFSLALRVRENPIRCYVDDDLNIRLDRDEIYFHTMSFVDKNGEDLSVEDLNKIRKIIDVKFANMFITNWYLVDLAQNKKVMGDYYQIPHITQLICNWLGQSITSATLTKHVHTLADAKKVIM
jgi:hypothetical protein